MSRSATSATSRFPNSGIRTGSGLAALDSGQDCTCTNEVFLWPSIVYQPMHLMRALIGAKPWREAPSLAARGAGCSFPSMLWCGPSPRGITDRLPSGEPVPMELPVLSERQD